MKRTVYLCSLALIISAVAFTGFSRPVLAYSDSDEARGEHCYAKVYGTYSRPLWPYYRVCHEAGIFECLSGGCEFIGWDRYNNVIYDVFFILGDGHPTSIQWCAPYYNIIWYAETRVWACGEYIVAAIGPPGIR